MTEHKNKEIPEHAAEIRSHAVTEVMGQAPNWVIRWGISVVLVIVVLILTGAALISYDDVIPARITVTTLKPPVYIKARSSGKISDIFINAEQKVHKNAPLAVIENTASLADIVKLKEMLDVFRINQNDLDSISSKFPLALALGDVQETYYTFINHYQNYLLHLRNKPNQIQARLLADQINEQQSLLTKQETQLGLFEEELKLSKNAYERNVSLLDSSIISLAEFENRSRAYLNDKQQHEGLKMQITNTRINISTLKGNQTNLLLNDEVTVFDNRKLLENAIQRLKNAIKNWEQRYLLKSPVNGVVTLFDVWNKYQNVEAGTVLFTVVPEDTGALIGRVVLPVQNSGKVSNGQKVIIKIDNYPHSEWGSLSGTITNISSVPKQGLAEYSIQVSIESLNTSFGKTMIFKQEMQGTAEIVTEKLTVLQRIFYQLRSVLSRN